MLLIEHFGHLVNWPMELVTIVSVTAFTISSKMTAAVHVEHPLDLILGQHSTCSLGPLITEPGVPDVISDPFGVKPLAGMTFADR